MVFGCLMLSMPVLIILQATRVSIGLSRFEPGQLTPSTQT
jgi:hypothetical protein